LTSYGFTSVNYSDCYYTWKDPKDTSASAATMQLVVHVDDSLLSFSSNAVGLAFKAALLARFDGTDEGPVEHLLGCSITRDGRHLHLSLASYCDELLATWGMTDCNPASTPLEPGTRLLIADRPETPDPVRRLEYQKITGSIQFLSQWTRPDLQFSANELAKHNSNPGVKHLAACYRVLRYIKGTRTLGITYTRDLPDANRLLIWSDADWASCTETRRSISAWVSTLNGGAVSWRSRQAPRVASSTGEAEFVSASKASDEALWLRRTLSDIGVPQRTATPLFCDNRAARMMSENPVHKERTKHVDYRVHILKERVQDGVVRVLDCPTQDMLADPLTKQLPGPAHMRHTRVQAGLDRHTSPAPPAFFPPRGVTIPRVSPSNA
jgi:hypothetical protein